MSPKLEVVQSEQSTTKLRPVSGKRIKGSRALIVGEDVSASWENDVLGSFQEAEVLKELFGNEVLDLPVSEIRPGKTQPRDEIELQPLHELAASIKIASQLVPILVKKIEGDPKNKYEIMEGERRWLAVQINGKNTVRSLLADKVTHKQQVIVSTVANFGRESHTPIEKARAIKTLKEACGWNVEATAAMFDMSGVSAYKYLSLLELDAEVLALMSKNLPEDARLNVTLATDIAKYKFPPELQRDFARTMVENGMQLRNGRTFLKRKAVQAGLSIRTRNKSPAEDYRSMDRVIQSIQDKALDLVVNLDGERMRAAFQTRKQGSKEMLLQKIGKIKELLDTLKERI